MVHMQTVFLWMRFFRSGFSHLKWRSYGVLSGWRVVGIILYLDHPTGSDPRETKFFLHNKSQILATVEFERCFHARTRQEAGKEHLMDH